MADGGARTAVGVRMTMPDSEAPAMKIGALGRTRSKSRWCRRQGACTMSSGWLSRVRAVDCG